MTAGASTEITNPPDLNGTQAGRRERRIAQLYASDPQFRAAEPIPAVIDAARRPGLRLPEVIETLVEGYRDRPALGQRARELVLDPVTGRTTTRLLPTFETTSYGDLWATVRAVAAAWRRDETSPVNPGDFVATVGFAGPSYLTVELVCAYLGLVSVPLQHSAPPSVLQPIIDEIEPRVLAAGAAYLDLAVESALQSTSLRHLVVFDYQPQVDEHRENLERARKRLHEAGMSIVVSTLDEVIQRGRELPPEPLYTDDTDQRLAMI
ncbi:MAG: AMP-binding protein, partial [Mycobacterium sp.]